VEKFIIAAANGTKEDNSINIESIVEFLNYDIDTPRLKCELNLLPDYFSTINLENDLRFKKNFKNSNCWRFSQCTIYWEKYVL
jgi:hypothetical protein